MSSPLRSGSRGVGSWSFVQGLRAFRLGFGPRSVFQNPNCRHRARPAWLVWVFCRVTHVMTLRVCTYCKEETGFRVVFCRLCNKPKRGCVLTVGTARTAGPSRPPASGPRRCRSSFWVGAADSPGSLAEVGSYTTRPLVLAYFHSAQRPRGRRCSGTCQNFLPFYVRIRPRYMQGPRFLYAFIGG